MLLLRTTRQFRDASTPESSLLATRAPLVLERSRSLLKLAFVQRADHFMIAC